MSKYRKINVDLNRQYRNDLNWNFGQISDDMVSVGKEIDRVENELGDTINDIVGGGFIESLENARDNANDAAINANEKANYADGRGKYANTQGNYAKEQGVYAKLKGDYADEKAILADEAAANANAEASNLDSLKVDVVDATQSANTAASKADDATADTVQATTDAQTATSAANTATDNANDAADLANEKAQLAQTRVDELNDLDSSVNEAIENAETAKKAANDAADNADSKATLAEEKAQLANSSASNADEKAILANDAATNADEKSAYATEQGDYAKEQGDAVQNIFDEGLVASVNGKTGAVILDAEAVNAIDISKKGAAGGVASLNEEGKVVDAEGNEVEGKVTSVNGKTGEVDLTADDVGAETPAGSQEKADAALSQAKQYADDLEPNLTGYATENYVDDAIDEIHTHENKEVLDKLTDDDGKLKYDGQEVGAVTSVNGQVGEVDGLATEEDLQNHVEELDDLSQEVAEHKADYVKHPAFAVATGTANNYAVTLSPAPTSYTDGMGVIVAINADATGTSTLRVNDLAAIPIKKADGNSVSNLKANGVYTLRYSAATSAFILQGEGGEYGTVKASDVRSTKTFGTEDGVQRGALELTDLKAINLREGIQIDGVLGSLEPFEFKPGNIIQLESPEYVQGTHTTWHKYKEIQVGAGGTVRVSFVSVTGSTATLSLVRIYVNGRAVGIERRIQSNTPTQFTEDIRVNRGDSVEIWAMRSRGNAYNAVRDFAIKAHLSIGEVII